MSSQYVKPFLNEIIFFKDIKLFMLFIKLPEICKLKKMIGRQLLTRRLNKHLES